MIKRLTKVPSDDAMGKSCKLQQFVCLFARHLKSHPTESFFRFIHDDVGGDFPAGVGLIRDGDGNSFCEYRNF